MYIWLLVAKNASAAKKIKFCWCLEENLSESAGELKLAEGHDPGGQIFSQSYSGIVCIKACSLVRRKQIQPDLKATENYWKCMKALEKLYPIFWAQAIFQRKIMWSNICNFSKYKFTSHFDYLLNGVQLCSTLCWFCGCDLTKCGLNTFKRHCTKDFSKTFKFDLALKITNC